MQQSILTLIDGRPLRMVPLEPKPAAPVRPLRDKREDVMALVAVLWSCILVYALLRQFLA